MMIRAASRRVVLQAVLAVPLCLALAVPASAQAREGSFERTLSVTGAVDLDITSGSGQIRIRPGAPGAVRISARLRADWSLFQGRDVEQRIRQIEQNPPVEQRGNTIRVGHFADDDLPRHISISYDVTVPAETKIAGRTGSGSIDIGDVTGPVDAHSGSGSVTIGRVAGGVVASAGSGSIRVSGAASLEARTGSGSIQAAAIAGPATAKSGSGSVSLAQAGKGDVDASAGSGSVRVSGVDGAARVRSGSGSVTIEGRPSGPWALHSSSGGVNMTVPPDAAFDLDARVSSGSIDSAIPITMIMSGKIDKRHVVGKVRGGGPLVEASSSSGGVRIR